MKLSLCITTYNRPELTIEAFEKVALDDRIDEIVVVDDASTEENYRKLVRACDHLNVIHKNKIRIYRNAENIGMSRNKARVIEYAKNDWCILFDSDNVLDKDYLDAFKRDTSRPDGSFALTEKDADIIFCPDFAKPDFNYTKYSDRNSHPFAIYGAEEAASFIKEGQFNCLMNTCNYIVNRKFYLSTYKHNHEHIASDTIWHNYNHLKAGGLFRIVPDMQYYHRVHKDSGFMKDVQHNIQQAEKVRKLISELCS